MELFRIRNEEFDAALENYQTALALYTQIQDGNNQAACLSNLTMLHKARGEYEEALQELQALLGFDHQRGNKGNMAMDLKQMGKLCELLNDIPAAIKNYQQSVELLQQIDREIILKSFLRSNRKLKH